MSNSEKISSPSADPAITEFLSELHVEFPLGAEDADNSNIRVAFAGRPREFNPEHPCVYEQSSAAVIDAFAQRGVELRILKQIHSATICAPEWGAPRAEGDAILCERADFSKRSFLESSSSDSKPRAIGLVTADCLPVVFVSSDQVAVVHAGWRGLASGIIPATLNRFRVPPHRMHIGPAAGGCCYQVGPEVIHELKGKQGVYHPDSATEPLSTQSSSIPPSSTPLRFKLNLSATGKAQIEHWFQSHAHPLDGGAITSSSICTMEDARYFSYRREPAGAGRNLTVVWVSSCSV